MEDKNMLLQEKVLLLESQLKVQTEVEEDSKQVKTSFIKAVKQIKKALITKPKM